MYLVAAVVIYRYGGETVASPALGSTGPLMSKIAYGIAIPTVGALPSIIKSNPIWRTRLSLLESSTATSHANMSTSVSSVGLTTCRNAACCQWERGWPLQLFFGLLRGLSPRQFQFSIPCWVWLYVSHLTRRTRLTGSRPLCLQVGLHVSRRASSCFVLWYWLLQMAWAGSSGCSWIRANGSHPRRRYFLRSSTSSSWELVPVW